MSAAQVADIRTHFEIDRTGFDPSRSLVSYLRALADGTDAAVDDFDAFAREASAIAGRRALDVPNMAPTAAFNAVPASGAAPLEVTFTSSSTDSDGTIVQYRWAYGDGVVATGNADEVKHTYTTPGSYTATLTVTDDDGATNSTSRTVVVNGPPANRPPVATAQTVVTTINTPVQITLSGTDADGDPLSYSISNPPAGTLTGTGAVRTYTPPNNQVGTDVFTFTANDGKATSAPATVTINIQQPTNTPPVATPQSVSTTLNTSIQITLSGTDANGDLLTYAIVGNPRGSLTGTGAVRTYRPPTGQVGIDSFAFTVNDGEATSAPAIVTITIGAPPVVNAPPVITSTVSSISTTEGLTVSPQRTVTDPDGAVVSQTWTTSEGYSGTAQPVFPDNGPYTLTLTAVDNWGASTSHSWPVTVSNSLPSIAGPISGRWRAGAPRPMQVTVTDPGVNDGPHAVVWDFGDGTTATGTDVMHTWATNGTYSVRVTATDKDGGARTNLYQVRITDLVVDAGSAVSGPDGRQLIFNFGGSTPPDAYVTYVVDWGDGTPPQSISGLSTPHTYTSPGNYTVTLTGTDAVPGAPAITRTDTTGVVANRPPTALIDTQSTPRDIPAVVHVLANDSDPNGDVLVVAQHGQPSHGTVACQPSGLCTYVPEEGYTGGDQFTYTIADGRGGTDSATVVVVVGIDVRLPADVVFAIDESAEHDLDLRPGEGERGDHQHAALRVRARLPARSRRLRRRGWSRVLSTLPSPRPHAPHRRRGLPGGAGRAHRQRRRGGRPRRDRDGHERRHGLP